MTINLKEHDFQIAFKNGLLNSSSPAEPPVAVIGDPIGLAAYDSWIAANAPALAAIYADPQQADWRQYDQVAGMRFVGDYLATAGTDPYNTARINNRDEFINDYVINASYRIQGIYQYATGLYKEYMKNGHTLSINTIRGWCDNINWTYQEYDQRRHQVYSREIAYGTLSLVYLEHALGIGNTNLNALGKDAPDRYPWMMTCMENHLYQWRNNDYTDPPDGASFGYLGAYAYMNPFMVGLTAFALAKYYDINLELRGDGNLHWPTTHWPDIPSALADVLSWMMDTAVVPEGDFVGERIWRPNINQHGGGAFWYSDRDVSGVMSTGTLAADLNMILAPAYAWVGKTLGDPTWITDRADLLFAGGIASADIFNTSNRYKRAGQQFMWAQEYFDWRTADTIQPPEADSIVIPNSAALTVNGLTVFSTVSTADMVALPGTASLTATGLNVTVTAASNTTVGDPVGLAEYDNYVLTNATRLANDINSADTLAANNHIQYDPNRVQRFVQTRFGVVQPHLNAQIRTRDWYNDWVLNGIGPANWMQYPQGLFLDYTVDGYQTSLTVMEDYQASGNWGFDTYENQWGQEWSREIAYALLTLVRIEQCYGLGNFQTPYASFPIDVQYTNLLSKAENHLYQWRFRDFSYPAGSSQYMQSFMVGLTGFCLAMYYDWRGNDYWPTTHWPDIPTALQDMFVWLHDTAMTVEATPRRILYENYNGVGANAMAHVDRSVTGTGGTGASASLGMLIAPTYAWLGKHFNNSSYILDYADPLFLGTLNYVKGWSTIPHKQFNQTVVWASEYFQWRSQV